MDESTSEDEATSADNAEESTEVSVDEDSTDAPEPKSDDDAALFKVMQVESILFDLTDPSPQVHLLEAEMPFRYLAIPIALVDAIALQNALSDIDGKRPSTHELTTTLLARLQGEIIAARIVRYEGGVFFSELDLMTPRGREVVDCRTSDAITLALRQGVPSPILCAEEVLQAYYS